MTNASLRVLSIIWTVACIVTGEVSVVPSAGYNVACVALNRLEAGWGFDGWHAIADEPESWALDVAWEAWRSEDTGGDLYALSESDIVSLGFDKRNWENVGSDRWPVWAGERWE